VVLGALIFAVEHWLAPPHRDAGSPEPIVVREEFVRGLEAEELRRSGRPLARTDLEGAIARYVRDEALYREAVRLGLDADDPIVRRRLVQKIEFLLEGAAVLPVPDDATLATFLEENADRYRVPPRVSFTHVFFSRDRRGEASAADAQRVLEALRSETPPPERASERGDPFLLQYDFQRRTRTDVERAFGPAFAAALEALPEGRWEGPVPSTYGVHLVRVETRTPGRLPALAEIRQRVLRDWESETRAREVATAIDDIVARYPVERRDQDEVTP